MSGYRIKTQWVQNFIMKESYRKSQKKQEHARKETLASERPHRWNEAYALDLAIKKWASCWLSAIPIEKISFQFNQGGV